METTKITLKEFKNLVNQIILKENFDDIPLGSDEDMRRAGIPVPERKPEVKDTTIYYIMIERDGKKYYLKESPYFLSVPELEEYARKHNVQNYSIKERQEKIQFNPDGSHHFAD